MKPWMQSVLIIGLPLAYVVVIGRILFGMWVWEAWS